MSKLPAFQFYPGDWLRDSVSGCSLSAQGLWLRIMFVMHDSDRYGYLSQNGSPIPADQVARRCGCTLQEFESLLKELELASVPSWTPDGILYSRRMVKDEKQRASDRDRKRKSRISHAFVTDKSQESHSLSSSSLSTSGKGESPPPIVSHETKIQTVFREPLFDRLTEQGRIAIREEYSGHEDWLYDTLSRYAQDCAAKNVFVLNPSTLFRYLAEDFRRKDRKAKPTGRDYSRDNQELEEKMRQWKQEAQT